MDYFYGQVQVLSYQELIVFIVAIDYFEIDAEIEYNLINGDTAKVMSHMKQYYSFIKDSSEDIDTRFKINSNQSKFNIMRFNSFVKTKSNLYEVATKVDFIKESDTINDKINGLNIFHIQAIQIAIRDFLYNKNMANKSNDKDQQLGSQK